MDTIASFIGVLIVFTISLINIYKHLINYSRPEAQSHVIRILLVCPIFALSAFLSLIFPGDARIFIHSIADLWEALVIYSFFMLILTYTGGEHNWISSTAYTAPNGIKQPWPFSQCFAPVAITSKFLIKIKALCVQFVLIKPISAFVSIILLITGVYFNETCEILRVIVYNISYTLALYALGLLYVATRNHPALKSHSPFLKFLTVKLVIFLTYWQQYLFALIPFDSNESRFEFTDNVTICEMIILSVLLNFLAFSYSEYVVEDSVIGEIKVTEGVVPPKEFGNNSNILPNIGLAVSNARHAFSPQDVTENAARTLNTRYQQHVLLEGNAQDFVLNSSSSDEDIRSGDKYKKVVDPSHEEAASDYSISVYDEDQFASAGRRGSFEV